VLALLAENNTPYGGGWLLLSACLGYWIGKQKGYPGWGVLLGVMCPILGLVIIAICDPKEPADPPHT
jgi:hypothetical protein